MIFNLDMIDINKYIILIFNTINYLFKVYIQILKLI
jgi:hypothetical protein